MNPDPRTRQKRTLIVIATGLILAGAAVLFLLRRMPLPLRALVGLTDVAAGAFLLWIVRRKF